MNYKEKNRLIDNISGALLMAFLVEIFYGITDSAFTVFNYNISDVTNVIYIFGGIFLAIALLLLIIAYRKDKPNAAIYGIEILVLALSAGLLPKSYTDFAYPFNKINILFPLLFGVYYVIKCLMIMSKRNKSNAVILGAIELIFIMYTTFALYAMKDIFFMIASVIAAMALIYSMIKRSKFVLTHALEIMIVSFSFLLLENREAVVFFGIMAILYYLVKAVFIATSKNKSSKRRKK